MSAFVIKPVSDIATVIKKNITTDDKTWVSTVSQDAYTQTLPEGITGDMADAVGKHNNAYAAASVVAFKDVAIENMQKNEKLAQAELQYNMNAGTVGNVSIARRREFSGGPGSTEKTVKYGHVQASVTTKVTGSDFKDARAAIAEAASKAFSS